MNWKMANLTSYQAFLPGFSDSMIWRSGKQPRILFATQASTRPPRFVLFASGFLEAGYRRFIERRLREEFGFEGTPIEVSVRVREKRRK